MQTPCQNCARCRENGFNERYPCLGRRISKTRQKPQKQAENGEREQTEGGGPQKKRKNGFFLKKIFFFQAGGAMTTARHCIESRLDASITPTLFQNSCKLCQRVRAKRMNLNSSISPHDAISARSRWFKNAKLSRIAPPRGGPHTEPARHHRNGPHRSATFRLIATSVNHPLKKTVFQGGHRRNICSKEATKRLASPR